MNITIQKNRNSLLYKALCGFIAFSFVFTMIVPPQTVQAQTAPTVLNLPIPGAMVAPSVGYTPPMIFGITTHPENPLLFDFLVGRGDSTLSEEQFKQEADRLVKYFLASLTVPEDEMWVNLSPYEKDRIVTQSFGATTMGRDLLAQDYLLKQLTASLMYPEENLGQEFWQRVYKKANDLYGTTEIPMNTFNKIWIVPSEAMVYQKDGNAYVINSHLKVMLEEDFVALQENMGSEKFKTGYLKEKEVEVVSGITSEVVREVLIPEIEYEVNNGKTFANLRQIFNSVILASWYKMNLRESLLGKVYVNQNKTKGIDVDDKQIKEKIYQQYLEAFQKGVYNYIKEDYDPKTQELIPRKYFSGGVNVSVAGLLGGNDGLGDGSGVINGNAGSPIKDEAQEIARTNFLDLMDRLKITDQLTPDTLDALPTAAASMVRVQLTESEEEADIVTAELETSASRVVDENHYRKVFETVNGINRMYGFNLDADQKTVFTTYLSGLTVMPDQDTLRVKLAELNREQFLELEPVTIGRIARAFTDFDELADVVEGRVAASPMEYDQALAIARRHNETNRAKPLLNPEAVGLIVNKFNEDLDLPLPLNVALAAAQYIEENPFQYSVPSILEVRQRLIGTMERYPKEAVEDLEDIRAVYEEAEAAVQAIERTGYGIKQGMAVTMDDLNQNMFKDYDFRSVGPEVKLGIIYRMGLVWARDAIQKARENGIDNRTFLFAKDARKLDPFVKQILIHALLDSGLNVADMAANKPNAVTPYSWGMQEVKPLGSVFNTSSHISAPIEDIVIGFKVTMMNEYNGAPQSLTTREIKNDTKNAVIELIQDESAFASIIPQGTVRGAYKSIDVDENAIRFNTLVGRVAAKNDSLYELDTQINDYTKDAVAVLDEWEARYPTGEPLKGMKVVVDGAYTPSGEMAARTFANLGAEVIEIHKEVREVEGEHKANPAIAENRKELEEAIIEHGAHFGMGFDLDGDRGMIVAPKVVNGKVEEFVILPPDNIMAALNRSYVQDWGYDANVIGKKVAVIRDALGTFGLNNSADQYGITMEQTDAGYPFLKKRRRELLKEGYVVPQYGESSGHAWTGVTGEIENPVAVTVKYAIVVKSLMFENDEPLSENPVLDANDQVTYPYNQTGRFNPAFHPALLKKLSSDERNDTGWTFESGENPPSNVVALGKDATITALQEEFEIGKEFSTPFGILKVAEFKFQQDVPEDGGLKRYADIVFEQDGEFAGRIIFRASSTEPNFVASYEAPINEEVSQESNQNRYVAIGGVVLDWLENNGFALVSQEAIQQNLELSDKDTAKKIAKLSLEKAIGNLKQYREASSPIEEFDVERAQVIVDLMIAEELETINNQLLELYGLTKEEALEQYPDNPFVELIFDIDDNNANRLGWMLSAIKELLDNPEMLKATIEIVEQIVNDDAFVIFSGMGGSGLSVELVKLIFAKKKSVSIHSLRTTDSGVIDEILEEGVKKYGSIEALLENLQVISITKSFTTAETLSHQEYFENLYQKFEDAGVSPEGHFTVFTDPGKPEKEKEALDKGYNVGYIQNNLGTDVGGRNTAPSTNVFLLPLMILTSPERAVTILQDTYDEHSNEDIEKDVYGKLGLYLHVMEQLGKDKVTFIVPKSLSYLPNWAEQLIEESLGKDGKGITVIHGEQLEKELVRNKDVSDRVYLRFNLGNRPTEKEFVDFLKAGGHPVFDINIKNLDGIGGVLYGLQKTVQIFARKQGIIPVHQPGVQAYKKGTRDVVDNLKEGEEVKFPNFKHSKFGSLKVHYEPLIEAGITTVKEIREEVLTVRNRYIRRANQKLELSDINLGRENGAIVYAALVNITMRKGLTDPANFGGFEVAQIATFGKMNEEVRSIMEDARYDLFTSGLRIASKLGEGPDYLHAFQQNIQEGKNIFESTLIIPGETKQPKYLDYDQTVNNAIPIGTISAIVGAKRKVIPITTEGTIADSAEDLKQFFNNVDRYIDYAGLAGLRAEVEKNVAASPMQDIKRIVQQRHQRDHLPALREYVSRYGDRLLPLTDEYQLSVFSRTGFQERAVRLDLDAIQADIDRIVDEANVAKELDEAARAGLLARPDTLTTQKFVEEFGQTLFVERLKSAERTILEGNYVLRLLGAGKATRLNRGAMWAIDIGEVIEEGSDLDVNQDYTFGMGPRQLIAYRLLIESLAQRNGFDQMEALNNQKLIIHLNDEVESLALNDLLEQDFYGFNPNNIYFINQPEFLGYSLRYGMELEQSDVSKPLVYGHGDNVAQLAAPNETYQIDRKGNKTYLSIDVLSLLGERYVATHRINDMTKFTSGTVVDVEKLALSMHLQEQGSKVVIDLVENPNKQKGGTAIMNVSTGRKFLFEGLAAKGSEALTELINKLGDEGAPYNSFRDLHRADTLRQLITTHDLKKYLRVKDGYLYLESVTGDLTQFDDANVTFVEGGVIQDFKTGQGPELEMAKGYIERSNAELKARGVASVGKAFAASPVEMELTSKSEFWDNEQNKNRALDGIDTTELESLKIDGDVLIRGAVLKGKVIIESYTTENSIRVRDLNSSKFIGYIPRTKDGRLLLEDKVVNISPNGRLLLEDVRIRLYPDGSWTIDDLEKMTLTSNTGFWDNEEFKASALIDVDTSDLNSLEIKGDVQIPGAVLRGDVLIESYGENVVRDLNREKWRGYIPRTLEDRLYLENTRIVIYPDGSWIANDYTAGSPIIEAQAKIVEIVDIWNAHIAENGFDYDDLLNSKLRIRAMFDRGQTRSLNFAFGNANENARSSLRDLFDIIRRADESELIDLRREVTRIIIDEENQTVSIGDPVSASPIDINQGLEDIVKKWNSNDVTATKEGLWMSKFEIEDTVRKVIEAPADFNDAEKAVDSILEEGTLNIKTQMNRASLDAIRAFYINVFNSAQEIQANRGAFFREFVALLDNTRLDYKGTVFIASDEAQKQLSEVDEVLEVKAITQGVDGLATASPIESLESVIGMGQARIGDMFKAVEFRNAILRSIDWDVFTEKAVDESQGMFPGQSKALNVYIARIVRDYLDDFSGQRDSRLLEDVHDEVYAITSGLADAVIEAAARRNISSTAKRNIISAFEKALKASVTNERFMGTMRELKKENPELVDLFYDVALGRGVFTRLEQFADFRPPKPAEFSVEVGSPIANVPAANVNEVGGINLNPALIDLQIKRDGNGVPLPLYQQPVESINIEGFLPVIINVTPITNLPLLLGIADEKEQENEVSYNLSYAAPYDRKTRLEF